MQQWVLFFAIGAPLGQYYCRFTAIDRKHAERLAKNAYPMDYTYAVPWDWRARMNIDVYQKKQIPMGAKLELTHERVG